MAHVDEWHALRQVLMAAAMPAGQMAKDAPVLSVYEILQILDGQLTLRSDGTLVLDTRTRY